MRINYIMKRSKAQGPGIRYTVWVQGCSIRCKGCSNTDTWDFSGGYEKSTENIISEVIKDHDLDGVTITGGEPLDQYKNTLELCKKLSAFKSIFLTTGYTEKQIYKKGYSDILNHIDIICMGPFEEDKICKREWRGSSNQIIKFITTLGKKQSKMEIVPKEIRIGDEGETIETGFTD